MNAKPKRRARVESRTDAGDRHSFLVSLGERVRALRSRKGITRKALSTSANVSERHLANLEYGEGNASIMVLYQISEALECPLTELLGDSSSESAESLLINAMLANQDEKTLHQIRMNISDYLVKGDFSHGMSPRIALIGLRGAGKSTLGKRLADELALPFVELSREIEKFAGCTIGEIQALYGLNAYRRYERRAIEEVIQIHSEAVICTPGGLVSDPVTFNELLAHCSTVWLQADPKDHMRRVLEQGDMRPMQGVKEAMSDLEQILEARSEFYSKAKYTLNTSAQSEDETYQILKLIAQDVLRAH